MALETVVYPQEQLDYFYNKEFYASINSFHHSLSNWESSSCNSMMQNQVKEYNWDISNFSAAACNNVVENQLFLEGSLTKADTSGGRRKRRRTARGSNKNREELENQRMTHIAVERNRRKQMNEYLTVLRSLMPSSYVQRVCSLFSYYEFKLYYTNGVKITHTKFLMDVPLEIGLLEPISHGFRSEICIF